LIAVDTSALMAIILGEAEADACIKARLGARGSRKPSNAGAKAYILPD
jgi:uncharacterized protein with PIN domain